MAELLIPILAVAAWLAPQPQHSAGLLVLYGNQLLVESNAFGACPPAFDSVAERYAPPLAYDYPPLDWTPSMFPYPAQQRADDCSADPRRTVWR